MSQNHEIEFKNMLTKEEYELLIQKFHITDEQIFSQENHYFDTADFALKGKNAALRIREKKNGFELTLKQPAQVGLLETNQLLTRQEAAEALQTGCLPRGIIQQEIEKMGILYFKMEYFGSLITKRVEAIYESGLLVLDHSFYLNHEDYELEYEVENYPEGKVIFHALLNKFGIPIRKTENKIRRFYLKKKEQSKD